MRSISSESFLDLSRILPPFHSNRLKMHAPIDLPWDSESWMDSFPDRFLFFVRCWVLLDLPWDLESWMGSSPDGLLFGEILSRIGPSSFRGILSPWWDPLPMGYWCSLGQTTCLRPHLKQPHLCSQQKWSWWKEIFSIWSNYTRTWFHGLLTSKISKTSSFFWPKLVCQITH